MDYSEIFRKIEERLENYLEVKGDSHEYGKEFYHFSFKRGDCLKENLEILVDEESFAGFLKEFLDKRSYLKLKENYRFFSNFGERDGKANLVFLKK